MNSPSWRRCVRCGKTYQVCVQGDSCSHPHCHDCLIQSMGKCSLCFSPHPHLAVAASQTRAIKKKTPLLSGRQTATPEKDEQSRVAKSSQGNIQGFPGLSLESSVSAGDITDQVSGLMSHLNFSVDQPGSAGLNFNAISTGSNTEPVSALLSNSNLIDRQSNNISPLQAAGLDQRYFDQRRSRISVAARNKKLARVGQRWPTRSIGPNTSDDEQTWQSQPRRCHFSLDCKYRAKHACKVCLVELCEEHASTHVIADQNTDHVLSDIEEYTEEPVFAFSSSKGSSPQDFQQMGANGGSLTENCNVHSFHNLFQYCLQCQELFCVLCKYHKHRWHVEFLQDVEAAAYHCREEIRRCKEELNIYRKTLKCARDETEDMMRLVEAARIKNDTQIEQWTEDIQKKITTMATFLKERNNDVAERKIKSLSYQKNMLELAVQAASKYGDQAQEALAMSSDKSLISFHIISSRDLANQTQESLHMLKPVEDDGFFVELAQSEAIAEVLSKSVAVSTNGSAYAPYCRIFPESDLWKSGFLKLEAGVERCTFQFHIELRNHLNSLCMSTRNQISLAVHTKQLAGAEFFSKSFERHRAQVEQLGSGTYRLTFSLTRAGTFFVKALVNDVVIQAPFEVRVYRGRDYRTLSQGAVSITDLNRAWGINTDCDGFVYIADRSNCSVLKLDREANALSRFGSPGNGHGEFNLAMKVAADSEKNLYITDKENNRIQKFDSEGRFLCAYGEEGSDLKLHFPWDIKVNEDRKLAVTDTRNDRVVIIRADGTEEFSISCDLHRDLKEPRGVCFLRNGDLLVTAFQTHKIFRIDGNSKRVTPFCKRMKDCDQHAIGGFSRPSGITQDMFGHVIIADTKNNRLQVFDEEGYFVAVIGPKLRVQSCRGYEPILLNSPTDVALSPDSSVLYILDGDDDVRRIFRF